MDIKQIPQVNTTHEGVKSFIFICLMLFFFVVFFVFVFLLYHLGFDGVQGKVLGPSFDSSSHSSEWLAMRPLVQCDDNVMTFTASGEGLAHLLVDRGKDM